MVAKTKKVKMKQGARSITINPDTLSTLDISKEEFFYLLLIYLGIDLDKVNKEELFKKEMVKATFGMHPVLGYTKTGVFLPNSTKHFLEDILLSEEVTSEEVTDEFVKSLQALFPQGKKYGTELYWRGNVPDLKRRLKSFLKKYGEVPFDKIHSATQKYVESFGMNTSYMQLLQYFIWKNKAGEGDVSALMNYIENEGTDKVNGDWTTNSI